MLRERTYLRKCKICYTSTIRLSREDQYMVSPWITEDDLATPDSLYAQEVIDYATFVLFKLSGEKYSGVSTATETYVSESRTATLADPVSTAALQNIPAIGIPDRVQYPQRLYLRGTPVHEVTSVKYGDKLLATEDYALYNRRFLKLRHGAQWDYFCDQKGITVTYSYGMMPPSAGRLAASTLANELLILLGENTDAGQCRIPERVTSVSREGVSFDMVNPMEFMDDGKTGIWEIDLFIRTANPSRAKKPPRILSANDPRRYRR